MTRMSLLDLPHTRQRALQPIFMSLGDRLYVRRRIASIDRQNKFIVVRWRTQLLPLPLRVRAYLEAGV